MSTLRPCALERVSTLPAPIVLVRFARHLRASGPRVPITRDLLEQLDRLVRNLSGGDYVAAPYGLWDEIVAGMLSDGRDPHPSTCGAPLLRFMGYLGDALREFGGRRIPPEVALALMSEFELAPNLLDYDQVGGRAYLEATPRGVEQFRGAVRLPLPLMPIGEVLPHVFASFFTVL